MNLLLSQGDYLTHSGTVYYIILGFQFRSCSLWRRVTCEQKGGIKGKENRHYRSAVLNIPEAPKTGNFFLWLVLNSLNLNLCETVYSLYSYLSVMWIFILFSVEVVMCVIMGYCPYYVGDTYFTYVPDSFLIWKFLNYQTHLVLRISDRNYRSVFKIRYIKEL